MNVYSFAVVIPCAMQREAMRCRHGIQSSDGFWIPDQRSNIACCGASGMTGEDD